jgi:hypothetical protein
MSTTTRNNARCKDCGDTGFYVEPADVENGPSADDVSFCSCRAGINANYAQAMYVAFTFDASDLVALGKDAANGVRYASDLDRAFYAMLLHDLRDIYRYRFL